MPLRYYCLKMNGIQFWNCSPKLVHCSQWQPCGVLTQHAMTQNLVFLKVSNFDIYVLLSGFWSNFGWPKIWVIPCWVTTPCGCHWLHLTNSGRQFQQWSLFTFKQYCLEGILAKEKFSQNKGFPTVKGFTNHYNMNWGRFNCVLLVVR